VTIPDTVKNCQQFWRTIRGDRLESVGGVVNYSVSPHSSFSSPPRSCRNSMWQW